MLRLHKIENSFFESNTYIVWDVNSKGCVIIDCGDSDPIFKFLEINKLKLESIFITHGHYDHIYGLNDIKEKISDVKIYASNHAITELFDQKLNYSLYHDKPFEFKGSVNSLIAINDGEKIKVIDKNTQIETIFTPGHDAGCLSYILDDYIFTGDSYIPGLKTVTNLRGNKEQAVESENKIKRIVLEQGLIVCPGHGDVANGLLTDL